MELKVSVAICTWNGERWIEQQLRSILNQTRQVDEIILGDDCSTDKTLAIAEELLQSQKISFRVIRNESNVGSMLNFQHACAQCSGDIVFLADQDDQWLPHKVGRVLEVFQRNPDVGWVFSDLELCDENLSPTGKTMWGKVGFDAARQREFDQAQQLSVVLKRPMVTGAALAVKRADLQAAIPFHAPWIHDHWISLVLSGRGVRGKAITDRLVYYRIHRQQQVGARQASLAAQIANTRKTVAANYLAECEALALLEPYLKEQGWLQVAKKIEHFKMRARILENPRYRRPLLILREWIRGNYQYSWSALAPVNDLIR